MNMDSIRNELNSHQAVVPVSKEWIPKDYDDVVDEKILGVTFTPDIFQKQAFYLLSNGNSVFVSAHTSSGKTLVAEYAIFKAQQNGNRVIYTSPIKALSNQKFYDFKKRFKDVGLVTGDVQVNPTAQCIIMTTEILRNLIYKNSDLLHDTEYVVFDEVHYINDSDRGVVWEEAIITMPKHITLVMLSASIPNALEFGEWVGRTRKQCIYMISTNKRAVPLEFVIYCNREAFAFDNPDKKSPRPTNFPASLPPYSSKVRVLTRFRVTDLACYISNRRLLPAIFFTFSRKICEEYGKTFQSLDLTNAMEKKRISAFLKEAVKTLREEDRYLPQLVTMQLQAERGIAVHHGGLLPFVKECVEILFSQNLLKILVATETFAMGVNMPAKCCVFLSVTKIDNGAYRYLTAGEFTQMSGRAGRRGMDKAGTVIIADHRTHSSEKLKKMIYGTTYSLSSQFKLSFSLILMALRSNIEVESLMRNSFKEHSAQKGIGADMKRLLELKARPVFQCEHCSDIAVFLKNTKLICEQNFHLIKKFLKPGDTVILLNNRMGVVLEINGNVLKFSKDPSLAGLSGKLFSSVVDVSSSDKILGSSEARGYCKYPITQLVGSALADATFDDVFAVVAHGQVFLDYPLDSIQDFSWMLKIKEAFAELEKAKCIQCPDFSEHYYAAIATECNAKEIKEIETKYDKSSLIQMNEYMARLTFLKEYGYIEDAITLKGRAAAELRTVNEILVVELIFHNEFESFTGADLISLFSAMICEGRDEAKSEVPEEFQEKAAVFDEYYARIHEDLDRLGIPKMEPLDYRMLSAMNDWCNGLSLGNIVAKHGVQEGTFVRLILRLEECCKEMIVVADLIGDCALGEKFASISSVIKRDIVFLPSLYL